LKSDTFKYVIEFLKDQFNNETTKVKVEEYNIRIREKLVNENLSDTEPIYP